MTPFRQQLEALGSALLLIERLPAGTIWSLTCTNEDGDGRDDSTVLNIYAPPDQWSLLEKRLRLVGDNQHVPGEFLSYRQESLTISLTKE
jgi:hypothetical protein